MLGRGSACLSHYSLGKLCCGKPAGISCRYFSFHYGISLLDFNVLRAQVKFCFYPNKLIAARQSKENDTPSEMDTECF